METKCLKLYVATAADPNKRVAIATVSSPKIIVCSQYADLLGDDGKLIATITWTSPVQVQVI